MRYGQKPFEYQKDPNRESLNPVGNPRRSVERPGYQRQPDYQLMSEGGQPETPRVQQPDVPEVQQPQQPAVTTPAVDYNQQLDALYSQIMNRPGFSFDLNEDALYQQLRDSYIANGQKAMMDTMGQAATLTGGYGNSYAQGVGQQAYQDYLQGLTDEIPDLYQMALSQYIAEGDALYDQLAALQWKAEFDEDQRRYNQAWEQEYGDPSGGGNGGSSGGTGGSGGNSGGDGPNAADGDFTEAELSEAGQNFLKNVPYLHAGGDVEGWKRTVMGRLQRALENGTLSDTDVALIMLQLGLEDIDPDELIGQTKEEPLWETPKEWYDTGGGSGGKHKYEMKPWG